MKVWREKQNALIPLLTGLTYICNYSSTARCDCNDISCERCSNHKFKLSMAAEKPWLLIYRNFGEDCPIGSE